MASNKFVIKCGNFAVLVDFHILPQGPSRDTSWFSDHEKEEVCMLLKDSIDSRVKQYLEARKQRGQWKRMEYTKPIPLSLKGLTEIKTKDPSPAETGASFHITAYFMKRWVNLRCVAEDQYRELHVFPERLMVCASRLESNPSPWTSENGALKENISNGTSEYFAESAEKKKCNIPLTQQIKQDILKDIAKRKKTSNGNLSKPQTREDTMKVYLGSVNWETRNRKNERQTPSDPQSEAKCRHIEQPKDCKNAAESFLF